jgi:predicted glycoside hydrolase/deacetylase ChbG (UPF0249 family)
VNRPGFTRLVVNADDAGIDAHVDACILRAARNGILSSATVLANGPTAAQFIQSANAINLGLGLHFNITEGPPLSDSAKTLTEDAGHFCSPKSDVWLDACGGFLDPAALRAEATAQWQALTAMGAELTHLDSHNHVHLYPCVLEALLEVLPRERPLHIRIPHDESCQAKYRPDFPTPHLAPQHMRAMITRAGHFATDHFVGFQFSCEPTAQSLSSLQGLADKTCEWMVHPGARSRSAFTSCNQREEEFEALNSNSLREQIEAWHCEIVRFGDLP